MNNKTIETALECFSAGEMIDKLRQMNCRCAAELNAHIDIATGNLLMQFTVWMNSKDWTAQTETDIREVIRYPRDWWQAFKETWFPVWLRNWFPVEYRDVPCRVIHTTILRRICPHLEVPEPKPHLDWLIQDQKGKTNG